MAVISTAVSEVLLYIVRFRAKNAAGLAIASPAWLGREGSRLARVVRLRRPLRHHHVRAHRLCFGHQEFKLAGLVAAGRKPGAVIALDPDFRAAQFG